MQPTKVVGRRVVAYILDYIVVYAVMGAVFFALADTDKEIAQKLLNGSLDANDKAYVNLTLGDTQYSVVGGNAALFFVLVAVVGIGYWVVLQGRTGWTLGKLSTGIRLVRVDGTLPAGVWKSFLRQLLWIADGFPYIIPNLTGFVVAMSSARNQRVGDIVAGTLVVRKEFAGEALAEEEEEEAAPAYGLPADLEPVAAAPPARGTASMPAIQPGGGGWVAPQPEPVAAPAAPVQANLPPADWYPDPNGVKRLRYWDGAAWTEHVAD